MRDDFTQSVKDILAKRVGYRCANPSCGRLTSGPHQDSSRAVSIGVAAHITAAASGGPRYDSSLSSEQRKSIENGIWLCQTHAKLIDSDEQKFPMELLRTWKQQAEERAGFEIENSSPVLSRLDSSGLVSYLQDMVDASPVWWLPEINESTWYEFELSTKVWEESKKRDRKPEDAISKSLRDAIDESRVRSILITGDPGAGKSTFLEKLAIKAACRALDDGNLEIPVLIKLKDYDSSGEFSGFKGLIYLAFENYLDSAAVDQLLKDRKLLLLIDGWNELSDEKAKSIIKRFCQPHSIFVTSRTAGDYSEIKEVFEIQPLSRSDVQDFFDTRLLNAKRQDLEDLVNRVQDFGQTPLMAWMLFSIFCDGGSMPETRGEAYQSFMRLYAKRAKAGIDLTNARQLLGKLAFEMMKSPNPEKPIEFQLKVSEVQAEQILGSETDLNRMLNHLLKQQGRKISFCHQSLQEYYAAEHLRLELENHPDWRDVTDEEGHSWFQIHYLNYEKWKEPIALMLGLPEITESQAEKVVKQALGVDSMLGARLAGEVQLDYQPQTVSWIRDLPTSEVFKAQLLGATKSVEALSDLKKILRNKESSARWEAVTALSQIPPTSETAQLLLQISKDEQSQVFVRLAAIHALGHLGDTNALLSALECMTTIDTFYVNLAYELGILRHPIGIQKLTEVLHQLRSFHQQDLSIAKMTISALKKINNESAQNALVEALNHPILNVRKFAVDTLSELGNDQWIPNLIEVLNHNDSPTSHRVILDEGVIDGLGQIRSQASIDALMNIAAHHNDSYIRSKAISKLAELRCESSKPLLRKCLSNSDSFVRTSAIIAIGNLGDKDATQSLLDLIESTCKNDLGICEEAIRALGLIGDRLAVHRLIQMLLDGEYSIQRTSSDSLGKIGGDEAVRELCELLRPNYDLQTRQIAARTLGLIGDKSVVPNLIKALAHETTPVEERLLLSKSIVVPDLLDKPELQELLIITLAVTLIKLDCCLGTLILARKLENANGLLSGYLSSDLFAELTSKTSVPILLNVLVHPSIQVHLSARDSLMSVLREQEKLSENILPIIRRIIQNGDETVCTLVIWTLRRVESKEAVLEILLQLLNHSSIKIQLESASELASLGKEVGMSLLVENLENEDINIRHIAVGGVRNLGDKVIGALINLLNHGKSKEEGEIIKILGRIPAPQALELLQHLRLRSSDYQVVNAIAAIQSNCKFYNHEIHEKDLDRATLANQQQAQVPGTIGNVGIINTGPVYIQGNQIGEQTP